MPYLNLDTNFFDHPKTRRLVGMLGPMSEILPIRLWAYCAKIHPVDGSLKGYSEAEVEGVIHWQGSELSTGKAVKALVKAGYLKKIYSGFACVDWKQHEGHLSAFSRRGKIAAKARWGKYASSIAKTPPSNAPTVPTVPTVPNLTKPTVPSPAGGETADQSLENGRPSGTNQGELAMAAIFSKPWHFKGDHHMKRTGDLPPDYCQWAIRNLQKLSAEERLACEIIIARSKKAPAAGVA